jgi:hypothetical protein
LGLGKQQEIQQIVSVFDGPWLLNPRTQVEEEPFQANPPFYHRFSISIS